MSAQQNLVPNGSFEDTVNCPSHAVNYYITACKEWMMPTTGTADYFNACSQDIIAGSYEFKVPQNYVGYQAARTGNAYGGYYAGVKKNGNNYYEYMSVRLIQPLKQGQEYKLTYYLSLADSVYKKPFPLQYVNHSGAYFSQSLYMANNFLMIPYIPQVVSDPSIFLDDSTGWQKVEGSFKAKGGEEYLTIGYFVDYNHIATNILYHPANSDSAILAYYYIDDVSVVETEEPVIIPNVFTPNGDGVNDTFRLGNALNIISFSIYNRWGLNVFQSDNRSFWDGNQSNGSPCIAGTYYYIIHTETETYKGFLELIK